MAELDASQVSNTSSPPPINPVSTTSSPPFPSTLYQLRRPLFPSTPYQIRRFLLPSTPYQIHRPHPPSNSTSIHSFTHFITIKLNTESYLLRKAQIVPFLKGHRLFGYVDGSNPQPTPTIDGLPNSEYTNWVLQDQLIVSTINASLSDIILAQVLNCSTSFDVWSTLQPMFLAQSLAHIMQTQFQLATLKNG
ncbi:hypothetical protein F2P56_022568 [Juglans regia]|uniref:Uncharacterized protein n=1 Tax=Juglans regia TaxID=51240 RepID=A0A833XA36_JUGRE|nr:hypothetical protein F2P56_022568 [Juglans regia]